MLEVYKKKQRIYSTYLDTGFNGLVEMGNTIEFEEVIGYAETFKQAIKIGVAISPEEFYIKVNGDRDSGMKLTTENCEDGHVIHKFIEEED